MQAITIFCSYARRTFKEREEQSVTMEEIVGVVSTKSFQLLVQWICLGRIVFEESVPKDDIATAIEFARLADMCGITGVESPIAEHIKPTIIANRNPDNLCYDNSKAQDTNTYSLTSQHIISASFCLKGIQCALF